MRTPVVSHVLENMVKAERPVHMLFNSYRVFAARDDLTLHIALRFNVELNLAA